MDVFKCILLICNRQASYWTHFPLKRLLEHKAVYCVHSNISTIGTITLRYSSNKKSSLHFYKEIEPKVLKHVGRVSERNHGENVYFEFNIKGNYYLFAESEDEDCVLSYEGSSEVSFEFVEFIRSDSLKNEECEYV